MNFEKPIKYNWSREDKWDLIKEELNLRGIKFEERGDEYDKGYFQDKCLGMILINGEECFGLFYDEENEDEMICSGEEMIEINYRCSVKRIVDECLRGYNLLK